MTTFTTPEVEARFAEDVLELLAIHGAAHQRTGNRDGEMSLSHLVDCLRARGWKNLRTDGWAGNVRDSLRAAGFVCREQRNGNALRVYVGL